MERKLVTKVSLDIRKQGTIVNLEEFKRRLIIIKSFERKRKNIDTLR